MVDSTGVDTVREMETLDKVFWLTVIVAVAISLWALLGDSPTEDQIIIAILLPIFTGLYSLKTKYVERSDRMIGIMESVDSSLEKIESRIDN
ncbi:MAG: hypothetical protein ABEJ72_11210 [Candidatus Aenigmatarchaeota archaeon]